MKTTLIKTIALSAAVFVLGGCVNVNNDSSYTSEDLGLRKTSLFEENISLAGFS
ncbi:MAG: hypothetical protein LBS39_00700 [Campylobacteraceae bacterium]|jgi:hypothetical protein|nr:hypothetical protein [Campylobacteraceae bacterium]